MTKLSIIKPVKVVEGLGAPRTTRSASHTVQVIDGVVAAFNGVKPVITVRMVDPERDASRLLRTAEELLPINRQAPGVVILDDDDKVQGVALRVDLEKAVRQMRGGEYTRLARGLGLNAGYKPPAGDIVAPFVCWRCPRCQHVSVPLVGHEDDAPPLCRLHTPPVPMERRTHGGK